MQPPFLVGGDFTKRLKNLALVIVMVSLLSQPAMASNLVFFSANVDMNDFPTEKIEFAVPEGIPENWYPLRAASEYLPLSVSWDEDTREVVIDSPVLKMHSKFYSVRRYDSSRIKKLEDQVMIVDGVTYCSAEFLISHLTGMSFSKDGVLYCYSYNFKKSTFVNDLGDEKFATYTNYVLGNYQYGAKYASTIYHEASHVYRARFGLDNSETAVKKYEKELLKKLTSAN